MGLVDAVLGRVTSGGSGGEEGTFSYRCRDCDAEFAEPRSRMVRVTCPECDSAAVRALD